MSTSDGQNASAAVFNAAYLSRTTDSSTVGLLALDNVTSGGTIANPQQQINDNRVLSTDNAAAIVVNQADILALQNSTVVNNYAATVAPTLDNDTSEGYQVGSLWVDSVAQKTYMAYDVTFEAAIWKSLGATMLTIEQTYFTSTLAVDDATWVELIADTGAVPLKRVQSFFTSGSVASVGIGAAASEVELYILQPGGNGEGGLDVEIPSNSRISIKLKTGENSISGAKLALNLFKEA